MSMDIDMVDTAHGPSAFLHAPNASDSAFQDDDGDDDGQSMEITEAIRGNLLRRGHHLPPRPWLASVGTMYSLRVSVRRPRSRPKVGDLR
jgi:hypothetical protein